MIQDAMKNNKSMQLISFDLEKAFDKTSHRIIEQALKAFGLSEIIIDAIKQGWAIALSLCCSLQKERQGAIGSFALFRKSKKEQFALSLFPKRAQKSNSLFCSFKKSAKEQIALSLFSKRAQKE